MSIAAKGLPQDYLDELNRDYYEDDPATYLRTRLAMQIALGDTDNPMNKVFQSGVEFAEVKVAPMEMDRPEVDRFLTVDVVALAHSSCETFLRQYAAHVELSPCPWIEVSTLRDPAALRRLARALVDEPTNDLVPRARLILRGTDVQPDDVEDARWEEDGEATAKMVRHVAQRFLNDSPANNAIKHGLAVLARSPSLTIGKPDDPAGVILDLSGPAVKFLVGKSGKGRPVDLQEVTAFVPLETSLRFTGLIVGQLSSMFAVARARYLGDLSGKMQYLTMELVDLCIGLGSQSPFTGLLSMSMTRTFTEKPR